MLHLRFIVLIALAAGIGLASPAGVHAQGQGLKLQRSIIGPPTGRDVDLPVFLSGERLEGITGQEMRASGDAELRKGPASIVSDRMKYMPDTDEVEALGNVRLLRDGDVMTGPALRYKLDQGQGVFEEPVYSLAPRKKSDAAGSAGGGAAKQMQMLGDQQFRMIDGTYSTCKPGNEDWYVRFGQLDLDYGRSLGVARAAQVVFMDVPILATPWLTFSLDNQRKSGFLAPSFGTSDKGGAEIALPYYWNIAPNYDATITPRYIGKRGLQVGTEFRYLQPSYRGEASYVVLPDDKTIDKTRWALNAVHSFSLSAAAIVPLISAAPVISGGWIVNTVSDNNYYRDLSSQINTTSLANLNREAFASSGGRFLGDGTWGGTVRVQRFQTLQDPLQPVAVPYARLPQLSLGAAKRGAGGVNYGLTAEYVSFAASTLVEGKRTSVIPTVSLPLIDPGAYLTPKLGYNWTKYALTQNTPGTPNVITRALPTFSVDSGLFFERPVSIQGRDLTQTLEPRLYYVNIPYRDQNNIPIFDTGQADFSFSQMFSENQFSGKDRVNNANQLTAAVTTRIVQPSGQELVRASIGQQYYFTSQQVTLPGVAPRTYKISDWVATANARVSQSVQVDGLLQYDPRLNIVDQANFGMRYQPEVQKLLNLGYRYVPNSIKTVEASGQWALGGGFYGVGRASYSLLNPKSLIEGLAGFEYDGGCWVVRLVAQRFATAVGVQNNTIFLQLELNGLASLGSNPLSLLKSNISGYRPLNQSTDPIRPLGLYN